MIITGLYARNVLKYARLDLSELPWEGMIAVSGQNESGKSTIGETVCFALFGRTFSLGPQDLDKLIRWGESSCEVRCTFEVAGRGRYEVARFLDNDGNHSARLNARGEQDQPLARGVAPVEEALYELVGFDFDEFVDSFYLAQREITTPHPHSHTVKSMAGIASLEYVSGELAVEVEECLGSITDAEAGVADIGRQIADLGIREGHLVDLEAGSAARGEDAARIETRVRALEQAGLDYQDSLPAVRKAVASRRSSGVLAFLLLVLAVLLGAVWAALTQLPDHPYSQLVARTLGEQLPGWTPAQLPMVGLGAGALALLWLLLLARSVSLKGRIARLSQAGVALVEELDATHQSLQDAHTESAQASVAETSLGLAPNGEVDDGELAEAAGPDLDEAATEPALSVPEPEPLSGLEDPVTRRQIAECRAHEIEVRERVNADLAALRRAGQGVQAALARLDQAIELEKERLARAEQLHRVAADLHAKVADQRQRADLRELAQELLAGASRSLSQRFNHELRNLVGRTLPLFTDGRYEHLQIDEDLQVRVFSNEKRNYMDLDEISSGTQRQIMLALRLALAQELVNSTGLGRQFVFLDEPFAFFDDERTRTSLGVLPGLSDELSQVWISSQGFPEGAEFARHIRCTRERDAIAESA